mmetsp:Transcript_27991/g.65264  ORF Transcript_27991/g.65264 Transcript_27991/m.65264 type:complete len:227 (+) Transcript_27991:415-1095(+)
MRTSVWRCCLKRCEMNQYACNSLYSALPTSWTSPPWCTQTVTGSGLRRFDSHSRIEHGWNLSSSRGQALPTLLTLCTSTCPSPARAPSHAARVGCPVRSEGEVRSPWSLSMATTSSPSHTLKCLLVSHTSIPSPPKSIFSPPWKLPVALRLSTTARAAAEPSPRHPARRTVPSARIWPLICRSDPSGEIMTMTESPNEESLSALISSSCSLAVRRRMLTGCLELHV